MAIFLIILFGYSALEVWYYAIGPEINLSSPQNVSVVSEFMNPSQTESFLRINQLLEAKDKNPPEIQTLLTQLTQLTGFIATLQTEADLPKAAFSLVKSSLEGALSNHPLEILKITASTLPEPISLWIHKIIDDTWEVVLDLAKDYVNALWKITVKKSFEEKISPLYPFSENSNQDLSLLLFKKFFGADGEFNQFYKTYLSLFDQTKTSPFSKSFLKVRENFIHTLESIRQLMFDEKENVHLSFSIEPYTLDKQLINITLTLADQKIEYRHGPLFLTHIDWFAPNQKNLCHLSCTNFQEKTVTAKYEGLWSIFRLIDHQGLTEPNILNVSLGEHKAQFLIHESLYDVFKNIRSFHVPDTIIVKIS